MLLTPLSGSKRLRNHIRCWAYDSGTRAGRGTARSAGRDGAPSCCWSCAASPDTLGDSNSSGSGTRVSSSAPMRATAWVASSELPPSSKKSSSAPTRSSESGSSSAANTSATICS
ncbi:Uncharacterised protein [Mycobacteroides abscessus subsp. abscessus]|nr:Uncharacterised protein [Mycobacteroides abscessus subsp. abscessus]